MAWRADIAGVNRTEFVHTPAGVTITRPLNERSTARFNLLAGLSPARFAEVVLYSEDGSTKLFGGVLLRRNTKGIIDKSGTKTTACMCVDYSVYGDWRYATVSYAAPVTLKQVLTDLVTNYLAAYGVTLDATQATGPTLAAFSWTNKRITDGLRELGQRTNFVFRIDPDKKLKMFIAGTDSSSLSITDADPNCEDLFVEDPSDPPFTRFTGVFGPTGTLMTAMTWTADGVETEWVTNIPAAAAPALVYVDNGVDAPFLTTVGAGGAFEFDVATSTLSVGTYGTPTNGTILTLGPTAEFPGQDGYLGQYPFTISKVTGGSPDIERVLPYTDITDYDAADEIVDQKLDEGDQTIRTFTITSREHGWVPGELVSVESTARSVSSTSVSITQVTLSLSSVLEWMYTISAQETTTVQQSELPMQASRELFGGGSGSVASVSGGGSSTVTLSSPFPLGGSDVASIPMAGTPARARMWMQRKFYAQGDFSGMVRAWLWTRAGGGDVTAYLYNETDLVDAGSVTATNPGTFRLEDPVTFAVTIETGKVYTLDVLGEIGGIGVYAIADLYSL